MLALDSLSGAPHQQANSIEIDHLTGLGNLFAFLKALKESLPQVSAQSDQLLAAVLFDIDGLMRVQAAIGEQATDYVITTIASTLYRAMPHNDSDDQAACLFRFTGDAFVMLIRHHNCSQVRLQAVRMQQAVANTTWETYPEPITVSASLVCFPRCASSMGDLLTCTTLCMQQTKQSQRGGITCAGNPPNQNERIHSAGLHDNAATLVEAFSDHILETAEQLKRTTLLAMTDPLTELPNLRAARQVLRQQLERAGQADQPLGLLLVDGDRLKRYNQLHGYSAGNEMIRWLGRQLQQWCGSLGFVSRWLSGDEFLVILPNQNLARCRASASELCNHISQASQELILPITVSVGIASYPESAGTPERLLEAAEQANERAKSAGRNQVSD